MPLNAPPWSPPAQENAAKCEQIVSRALRVRALRARSLGARRDARKPLARARRGCYDAIKLEPTAYRRSVTNA